MLRLFILYIKMPYFHYIFWSVIILNLRIILDLQLVLKLSRSFNFQWRSRIVRLYLDVIGCIEFLVRLRGTFISCFWGLFRYLLLLLQLRSRFTLPFKIDKYLKKKILFYFWGGFYIAKKTSENLPLPSFFIIKNLLILLGR